MRNSIGCNLTESLLASADEYKCRCIDFYLSRFNCSIIANEFRYGRDQLRTDLLFMTPRNLVSIEIKTRKDDLRRLPNQVSAAKRNFNFVIVFSASNHLAALQSMLPEDVGITVYNDGAISVIRKPLRNKVDLKEIISTIPAVVIKKHFHIPARLNSDEIREFALAHNKFQILRLYRVFLYEKYIDNYKQFLSDRGGVTHIEDIPVLSMNVQIAVL